MNKFGYGTQEKKFVFYDTDHQYAKLRIKLHHDNIKQGEFFRALVSGYIEDNIDITKFIENFKQKERLQSKNQMKKIKKEKVKEQQIQKNFALRPDEIEDIFDILVEECPEL